MKYLADDGKIFDIEEECRRYERNAALKTKFSRLNRRKIEMIYGNWFAGDDCYIEFFDINSRSDLLKVRDYCHEVENVDMSDIYGFDEEELRNVEIANKYPFTAVVIRRTDEWAELLRDDKTYFIKRFENLLTEFKEA